MDGTVTYPETQIKFIERIRESENVYTYVFSPQEPILYTAGQYAHVRVTGMPEGVRSVREFSFLSAPHEKEIRFGIDIRSGSDYQKHLESLKPDDTVSLFKIKNHMTWPPSSEEAVMIAGGIGVTPFVSMLADRKERNVSVRTTLLHVARAGFAYEKEACALADEYVQLGEHFTETLLETADKLPKAHYYTAGSPRFVDAVNALLSSKGITSESDPFKGLLDI